MLPKLADGLCDFHPAEASVRLSATSFLNALLREWTGWTILSPKQARDHGLEDGPAIALPLPSADATAYIRLARHSRVGRHEFRFPLFLCRQTANSLDPIGFERLASMILDEPSITGTAPRTARQRLLTRLRDSIAMTEAILAARQSNLAALFEGDLDFIDGEQGLLLGHPVHPTPKSRDEFSASDAVRYSPEFATDFALRWIAVDPSASHEHTVGGTGSTPPIHDIVRSDPALGSAFLEEYALRTGHRLLPVHPWQADHLFALPSVGVLRDRGLIHDLGEVGGSWRPTSSLRTLHADQAPFMLKFSMSVRLTNSTRVLQPKELDRGTQICRVLDGPIGHELRRRFPQFRILTEPAHAALRAEDGTIIPESIVVLRENPFRGPEAPHACVLGTLCQDHPDGGLTPLAGIIRRIADREHRDAAVTANEWFDAFLTTILEPLLITQADYGLLFSAHLQNTLIGLRRGWPSTVYFRDCQGTGFSPLGRALVGDIDPALAAEIDDAFDTDEGNRLFCYYLVINTVFSVIAALTSEANETDLLLRLRRFLQSLLRRPPRDPSCIAYLLDAPTLWSKGNFLIALHGVNETTAAGSPLASYVPMPNPLRTILR